MKIHENKNLINLNTFKINSVAKKFIEIESKNELNHLDDQIFKNTLILGGGSNIILPEIINKTVLHTNIKGIEIIEDSAEAAFLRVGAGENWHKFVEFCVNSGYYGFENLALIPGKVGAAPIQNIGAYGVEQSECFVKLEYFDLNSKNFITVSKNEANFGYRNSLFKNELKGKSLITYVVYKLSKKPVINIGYKDLENYFADNQDITPKDVFEAVVDIRTKKLPDLEIYPNCGSFFKNPVVDNSKLDKLKNMYDDLKFFAFGDKFKIPAAWLIQKAELKGFSHKGAKVYEKHALVLCNNGDAQSRDVIELKNRIIEKIKSLFDIDLEPEVNIIEN